MPTLSNAELAAIITRNHHEVTEWLGRVENQVKLTNGRVKELERKEIGREAVNQYKNREKSDKRFDVTTLIAVGLLLATIAGVIVWIAKA